MREENLMSAVKKLLADCQNEKNQLQAKLADMEQIVKSLVGLLEHIESMPPGALSFLVRAANAEEETEQKTHFEKIRDFIASGNNESRTIPEIEQVTKIGRSSISAVLYRTHPQYFVKDESVNSKLSLWRLTTKEERGNLPDEDIPF